MAELPTATPDGELGTLRVDASTWLGLALSLPGEAGTRVILARNMEQELAPHLRIERSLYLLASLTLLLSVVVAARVAHGISRPVSDLTASAGRIEAGDYGAAVPVRGRDELARLAEAFNGMAAGLRERDRVRDLLGKAVSREIASELLRRPVALGGEEREVTVMFTDVRGFTGYSERIPPTMLVSVLNAYFTRVTRVIERHGGIVDKYIGDAVMAVFGAPLDRPDHAARAIACARDVMRDLDEWNREREARSDWPLRTGIGIATGVVVAGNLGSETRHNYTVMGEAANLAARLQDLTKEHGVPCLIAAETVNRAGAGTGLVALGRIAVRGRSEPIDVFSFATV